MFSVDDIEVGYSGIRALRGVSLHVNEGETVAMIGPNGAGKSSLIKLVAGELAADAGAIRFAGRDIGDLDQVSRARLGLTRTFQVSSLIPEFSARGNVALAAQARRRSVFGFVRQVATDPELTGEAMDALERVGLADRAGTRVSELSHGEKRLLEIAMALAMKPRIFLMDEPMAGLGQEGSVRLIGFLDKLRHEAPILLIEHDMDAVFQLADRISVLVAGRIIARGNAEEIRSHPEVRAAYLGEDSA